MALLEHLNNASSVVDHFHVIQTTNKAIDDVRRRVGATCWDTGATRQTHETMLAWNLPAGLICDADQVSASRSGTVGGKADRVEGGPMQGALDSP